jgi:hypothetical protein
VKFSEMSLGATDRGICVGMTGCGKTTLAQYLCDPFPRVICYDAKGSLSWNGYARYTKLRSLVSAANGNRDGRFIYAPIAGELRDEAFHEAFFRFCYERKRTLVYVDEVYSVAYRDDLPSSYHAILTRGRERGVGLLSSTQRPNKIPAVIMSESENWYTFRLSMPQDKKKVEETIGLSVEQIAGLPKREFFYSRADRGEHFGPFKLALKEKAQNGESK